MNELLGRILDAHGGLECWNGYKKVDATMVSGGGFFPLKGVPQDPSPRHMTAWLGEKQVQVFAKLNPQFDDLTLGQPQEVHWRTSTGFDASGVLLLPPNYAKGVRYPLVIHTKPFSTGFVCSFGNFPSFAPQPIANAGIMYLGPGRLVPKETTQREENHFPKGYPGASQT